jgi:hypothetical protein
MPNEPMAQPYGDKDYDLMCTVGKKCVIARDTLERLGRAGFPVADQLEEINAHADRAAGLKREFFPGRP